MIDVDDNSDKKRKETSMVWKYFDAAICHVKKVRISARCKHCRGKFVAKTSDGTNHLLKHIKRKHISLLKDDNAISQMFLAIDNNTTMLKNFKYDPATSRHALISMMLLHEYPFNMVEDYGFKKFVGTLQPQFTMFCRNTAKKDCCKLHGEKKKKKMYSTLESLECRISFTSDWFIFCLTAHYIDSNWKL